MSLKLGNTTIAGSTIQLGQPLNIGQIVQSVLPLTDAGLHLLDGALILGGGIYDDFVTYILGLVSTYPDCFTTEANWQSAVSTYGVCGKFVYDSVNNTVRLPKYSNKIYTKALSNTVPVKGNGISLGLTDGTNYNGISQYNGLLATGPGKYGVAVGTIDTSAGSLTQNKSIGITTDGTKSGIIADLANITTSLDGYYYIVIATTTKTEIQVDIDEVVTDLNGKADTDLTNLSNAGNIKTAHNAMPSGQYIDLTVGATETQYQAPADGYFMAVSSSSTGEDWFTLYNATTNMGTFVQTPSGWDYQRVFLPVKKGDYVALAYGNVGVRNLRFIYAIGSESEV